MLLGTLVLCLVFGVVNVACKGQKGTLEINESLKLAWRINSTKGTIRFRVTSATIDKEMGWFLIGLAPQNNSTKISIDDIAGYGCIVWKGILSENEKIAWHSTDVSLMKGKIQKSSHPHYHLGSLSFKNKVLSALLWRKLKDDEHIIEIKPGHPVTVFVSYGNNHDGKSKWKKLLKTLNEHESVRDAFTAIGNVDFFKTNSSQNKNKAKDKSAMEYAAAMAEKHWIGVVIGISAFLTVIITCSVYCFTKKKKAEFKRVVSMPFHKNTDYDDEAKVAFLQSEET